MAYNLFMLFLQCLFCPCLLEVIMIAYLVTMATTTLSFCIDNIPGSWLLAHFLQLSICHISPNPWQQFCWTHQNKALNGGSLMMCVCHVSHTWQFCLQILGVATQRKTYLRSDMISLYKEVCEVVFVTEHYMWQSRVEIEHYSVAYFDHIAVFKAL